ncbi:FAD-dependent oxidoreductase [Psychrobacter sp. JCM 18900]|uniref:FAD-dependent oxidoreductase n=1 Tax=Psychrobacter sp. JCM 18900 TaxID=1298608 RepID=UPI0021C35F16|nr:FAD-dependent oxidoreductase [Psychrobacter sp. JCM 18900]
MVNRPQWFTIKGGSKQYVNKLIPRFIKAGGKIRVNSPVQSVVRDGEQVILTVQNALTVQDKGNADNRSEKLVFDEVVFACHADTALKILKDASTDESEVLGRFRFTKNTAVLHTDTSVLPKKPLAWASWNYLIDETVSGNAKDEQASGNAQIPTKPVLTYHMNILQRLTKKTQLFGYPKSSFRQ